MVIEDPQPPYEGLPVPRALRDVPFEDLPPAIRQRLETLTEPPSTS
jgi:hypothetical protein